MVTRPSRRAEVARFSFLAIVPIIALVLDLLPADEVFILPARTTLSALLFSEKPPRSADLSVFRGTRSIPTGERVKIREETRGEGVPAAEVCFTQERRK
jgi:hypothetical protein